MQQIMAMSAATPLVMSLGCWVASACPIWAAIGIGNVIPIEGVPPTEHPQGGYGKMQPYSAGKDTIQGHWEMMGIYLSEPSPTYPNGFPPEIMDEFEKRNRPRHPG